MYMLWIISALLILLTPTWGQSDYQCTTYCHTTCTDSAPPGGVSPCRMAQIVCDCGSEKSKEPEESKKKERLPFTHILMVLAGIFIFGGVCLVCYRGCQKIPEPVRRRRQYPAVVPHIEIGGPQPNLVVTQILMPRGYHGRAEPAPFQPQQIPSDSDNNMSPSAPSSPHPNIMETDRFIDPPPSYGQVTITPPETDPPSYTYSSKYRTCK